MIADSGSAAVGLVCTAPAKRSLTARWIVVWLLMRAVDVALIASVVGFLIWGISRM